MQQVVEGLNQALSDTLIVDDTEPERELPAAVVAPALDEIRADRRVVREGRLLPAAAWLGGVGVVGKRDASFSIPPMRVDVDAKRILMVNQAFKEVTVPSHDKVTAAKGAFDIGIESQKPGGVHGVAGTVGRSDKDPGKVGVFRRPAETGEWEHVITEFSSNTVHVHPTDPNIVFAGTHDGVYRSTDRGKTFSRTNFPDKKMEIWSFLVDAGNPKLVYAGGSPLAVYRSRVSTERSAGQFQLPRARDGGQTTRDPELAQDTVDVAFHRADCQHQFIGDLLVGSTRDEQPQYLGLALGQRLYKILDSARGIRC